MPKRPLKIDLSPCLKARFIQIRGTRRAFLKSQYPFCIKGHIKDRKGLIASLAGKELVLVLAPWLKTTATVQYTLKKDGIETLLYNTVAAVYDGKAYLVNSEPFIRVLRTAINTGTSLEIASLIKE
jgi:hypothetical protein